MIGLDLAIKPEWIHEVLSLWRPEQPISELMQAALSQTIREVTAREARRKRLTIILRYFVATKGDGNARRTRAEDVWVAYGRVYPPITMAPAYLAHLTAQNEVARESGRFIMRRHEPGDTVTSGELRRHIVGLFGERKVVTNAVSALMRTLDYFGAAAAGRRLGEYQLADRLAISRDVFPLIVWSWWLQHLSPQIELEAFDARLARMLLSDADSADLWRAFQPALWSIEERLEGKRATLKYSSELHFRTALLERISALPEYAARA